MPLQLRRGLDTGRLSITPVIGELIYVTDTKQVFVGDGTTVGGIPVGGGGAGYAGSRGLLGYTGSAGLGFTGSAGLGFTGSTGAIGYTGSVGTGTGTVGYAGSRGYSGSTGYTGSAGLGFTGSAGAQGLTGYAGSAGTGGTGTVDLSAISQSIIPNVDVGLALGSTTKRWEIIYSSNALLDVVSLRNPSTSTYGYLESPDGIQLRWNGTNILGAGSGYTGSVGARGYTGSAGSGGGTSGINVWDEDLFVGTFANLNFVGASVVASTQSTSSGGYAAITLSASTGTGAVGYTGSAGLGYTGSAGTMGYTGSAGLGYTGSVGTGGAIKTFVFKTTQTTSDIIPSYSIDGLDIARNPEYYPVRNPEFSIVRGQTYQFDLTNVPSASPWALSLNNTSTTAVPGTIGNNISSGVAGDKTTPTIVTYTVPFDAPPILSYRSLGTGQNGMRGIIKVVDNYFPTNAYSGQTIFPDGISSPMIYDDINLKLKASTSTFSLLSQTYWNWDMGGGVYSQPNVITYDLTSGTNFMQIIQTGTVATNWIANFNNVPGQGLSGMHTTALGNGKSASFSNNGITRVKLILKHYESATRIPTQVWINNTNTYVSVYWKNGVTPASINTSTARRSNNTSAFDQCIDILTFDILAASTFETTVLASIENYSQIPGYTKPNWPN